MPATDATHTAGVRLFSTAISVVTIILRGGLALILPSTGGVWNAVPPLQPVVQVKQLATLAAEWPERVSCVWNFLFTDGAPHDPS